MFATRARRCQTYTHTHTNTHTQPTCLCLCLLAYQSNYHNYVHNITYADNNNSVLTTHALAYRRHCGWVGGGQWRCCEGWFLLVFVKRCLAPSAPQVVDVADDGGAPKLNVTRSDYADTCKRTGQKCYLLVGITWKTARVCVCVCFGES